MDHSNYNLQGKISRLSKSPSPNSPLKAVVLSHTDNNGRFSGKKVSVALRDPWLKRGDIVKFRLTGTTAGSSKSRYHIAEEEPSHQIFLDGRNREVQQEPEVPTLENKVENDYDQVVHWEIKKDPYDMKKSLEINYFSTIFSFPLSDAWLEKFNERYPEITFYEKKQKVQIQFSDTSCKIRSNRSKNSARSPWHFRNESDELNYMSSFFAHENNLEGLQKLCYDMVAFDGSLHLRSQEDAIEDKWVIASASSLVREYNQDEIRQATYLMSDDQQYAIAQMGIGLTYALKITSVEDW